MPSASAKRQRDHGIDLETGLDHALGLLGAQDLGDVGAGAIEELPDLALDLRIAAPGGEQIEEQHPEAGVVLDRVLEVGDQDVEQLVDGPGVAQRLVQPGDPVLGVTADHLDQQRSLVPK